MAGMQKLPIQIMLWIETAPSWRQTRKAFFMRIPRVPLFIPVCSLLLFCCTAADIALMTGNDAYFASQVEKENHDNAIADNLHPFTQKEVGSYLAHCDSVFGKSHIGFKNIFLSMTPQDLDQSVQHSPIEYTYGQETKGIGNPKKRTTANGTDFTEFLKPYYCDHYCDSLLDDQKDWGLVGCRGKQQCYHVQNIFLTFSSGKISEIELKSPEYSADEIESDLKGWTDFIITAFSQKYGQPTETFRNLESFSILNFESNFVVFLCKWVVQNEAIKIGLLESDSKFYGVIDFSDLAVDKQKKEDSRNINVKF